PGERRSRRSSLTGRAHRWAPAASGARRLAGPPPAAKRGRRRETPRMRGGIQEDERRASFRHPPLRRRRKSQRARRSEAQVAQRRVFVWSATERPPVLALSFVDDDVVNARVTDGHEPFGIEFPVFVPVTPEPMTAVVAPLVGKAHGDAILPKRPQLLDQTVVDFALPLAHEECFDGGAALEEFASVPPAAVLRVRERDARGVAAVPGIFRKPHFLRS